MIKLTVLQYKLKLAALQRYHNINEHNQGLIFEWEIEEDKAKSIGTEYPKKPFIEPFEFENADYNIEEKSFRTRLENIHFYKENADGVVVVYLKDEDAFTVKETIKDLDALFSI